MTTSFSPKLFTLFCRLFSEPLVYISFSKPFMRINDRLVAFAIDKNRKYLFVARH
jgi:hypothetical protein